MVVIDDKIYTAGGADGKTGVIYSLRTDDGSIHWKSVQSNPIDYFIDIETDGKALYLSGTSNGHGRGALRNTYSYKYDLDGKQVWYSNSWHYGQYSEEYGATIFENQLISAGKTHRARNSASGNFLVSRDLETGDVQWTKRLRDGGSKFVDIVTYKGTVYAASIEGSAAVIHELEKDGAFNTMGRQLWINLPDASTKGWSFVIANDELYLSGTTTGDTGIAENQGGTDIFLAKITTCLLYTSDAADE